MYTPNEHPEVDIQIHNLWQTFSILDTFGTEKNVENAHSELLKTFGENPTMLTAACLVLNWKLWDHYNAGRTSMAKVYERLWEEVDAHAVETLKGDDLHFYTEVTD